MPPSRLLLRPVLIALIAVACGGNDGAPGASTRLSTTTSGRPATTAAACGEIVREPLDPASGAHVLPNAPAVEFTTDPPTSGPHQPGRVDAVVLDEPIPRPVQVGMLEDSVVLLQHRDLGEADRRALEALAGGDVVVAPAPDLPAAVVATAWVHKRVCDRLDVAALEEFIADRAGRGPGSDG